MRPLPAIVLAVLALCACSREEAISQRMRKQDKTPYALAQINAPAPASAPSTAPTKQASSDEERKRNLAYEHSVQVNTDADKVAPAYDAVQAACAAAVAEDCVVLRASLLTGVMPGASMQLRARAAGIRRLTELLGTQGEIASRTMSAEDLGGPIEDGEHQLAMLRDYRARLEDLRGRAGNTLDTLIHINHELAQVQSQIEAQAGTSAGLQRRVATELLNIQISIREQPASAWRPAVNALKEFGANLAGGISAALATLAYALPFGTLLLAAVWLLRRVWRGRRKAA